MAHSPKIVIMPANSERKGAIYANNIDVLWNHNLPLLLR